MAPIIVYSSPGCGPCYAVKDYLTIRGVDFVVKDVSEDMEARKRMAFELKSMGTPTIEINGKVIIGFDRQALDVELAAMTENN
jgi:glutaredoxin-like YruB-family protein